MDPQLIKVVQQVAASKGLEIDPSAFEHINQYDEKFKEKEEGWNSPVIQAVLADSAIKIALIEGHSEVKDRDAQSAVWGWKPEGDLTMCRKAGKRIIRGLREEKLVESLNPEIATYVLKNLGKEWGLAY